MLQCLASDSHCFFFALKALLHTPPAIPIRPKSLPIEVGLFGSGGSSASQKLEQGRINRKTPGNEFSKKPRQKFALKDLGIPNPLGLHQDGTKASSSTHKSEENGCSSPFGFKSQLTEKTSPVLNYLYRRMRGNIGYPSEIYGAWLQGDIAATLRFDSSGKWIDEPSAFQASDLGSRYLRIHVLRRLRALLGDPIPENIWKKTPQPFSVEARFLFVIIAPESVEGAQKGPLFGATSNPMKFSETNMDGGQGVEDGINRKNQGAFGGEFLFYHSHVASKLDWKLGPFAGYGTMTAVGIDPEWFAKTISDWIHDRVKIDPLEKYRDDPEW